MKTYTSQVPETEDVGIADNDIDGFLKNLLASVNRESAQNSNDESEIRPVKMSFEQVDVPVSDIPDVDSFKDIINRCHDDAITTGSKKGQDFFLNAKKVLSQDKLKILLISDEGTKGAGGEFKKGGKFYTLVVSKGRTDKDDVYSAGSFGIGKNALLLGVNFAVFSIPQIMVKQMGFDCMGKSVLTSWSNENGGKYVAQNIFWC